MEIAGQIAAHSPLGVQMTKRALQVNTDASDLSAAIEVENRNQVITHATEEAAAARGTVGEAMRSSLRHRHASHSIIVRSGPANRGCTAPDCQRVPRRAA